MFTLVISSEIPNWYNIMKRENSVRSSAKSALLTPLLSSTFGTLIC